MRHCGASPSRCAREGECDEFIQLGRPAAVEAPAVAGRRRRRGSGDPAAHAVRRSAGLSCGSVRRHGRRMPAGSPLQPGTYGQACRCLSLDRLTEPGNGRPQEDEEATHGRPGGRSSDP